MLTLIANNGVDNTCCQNYESGKYKVAIFYTDDVVESAKIIYEDFFAPTINIAVDNGEVTRSTVNIAASGSLNSLEIIQHIQKVMQAHEVMLEVVECIKKGKDKSCAKT